MHRSFIYMFLFFTLHTFAQDSLCGSSSFIFTKSSLGNPIGIADTICIGDSLGYVVINAYCPDFYGVDFSWIMRGVLGPDTLRGKTITVAYSDTGTFSRFVYGSSTFSIDSAYSGGLVVVLPCPPVCNFSAQKSNICPNQCITFADQSTRLPDNWQWVFEGGTPATYSGQYPPPVCYTDSGSYRVTLTVSSPYGSDSKTKTDYIHVNPGPTPVATGQTFNITEGDSVTLNTCAFGDSYNWQQAGYVLANYDTVLTTQPDYTQSYQLIVSAFGCTTPCSYTVYVKNGLLLPTGFTPNGDGVNDVFRILNTNIALNYFAIYNRWGQKVFETKNIQDGWDGVYQDVPQPVESYVWQAGYTIINSGKTKTAKGNVTLVR